MASKPSLMRMWTNFQEVNVPVSEVGQIIGGRVGTNIANGIFTNACAIRLSYALNFSGHPISRGAWSTSSGSDGKWYIFRVTDMIRYLTQKYGNPDFTALNPSPSVFSDKKGIILFKVDSWSDATGHATLWNGHGCSDSCYFPNSTEALIWYLD